MFPSFSCRCAIAGDRTRFRGAAQRSVSVRETLSRRKRASYSSSSSEGHLLLQSRVQRGSRAQAGMAENDEVAAAIAAGNVCEAKIQFRQLKSFPAIDENNNFKISTANFLESSHQIVDAIGCFGKLFSPIVKDMRQNVKKLEDKFKTNETLFAHIEDLILKDAEGKDNPYDTVTDGLLWLKRAFEMMELFFRKVLEDETCSEQLKPHLRKAYEECLLPYHGFLAQKGFQILHFYVPSRTSLLGPSDANADNLKALDEFLVHFRANLHHLNEFFTKHDLHRTYKA
ncbi:uncharacterized protein LOC118456882 [Anopheles albimanus]|uniref:uncharacterized protein LOC118456882 n=1 Tax=Anopheles albimanus TaxID=7167 RepID=UPI0016411323|nr:uncharacterized protein LOC118456882 [Anopheles albimanus]XP_035773889.1 uncharacterized protein LOC118456882 [Anopheles albimanus]